LAALIKERCERVGFSAIDVTGLAGIVTGYVRDRPMSPRSEIEMFMQAYAFDAVESEGLIKFIPRGRASVATIEVDDCVLPDSGEPVSLARAQETDLPDVVSITFVDGSSDYESGSVSASRIAGYSDRKSDASFALVMDETQAQAIADRALAEAWVARETGKFGVPPSLMALDPSDVITLMISGRPRAMRLTRIADAGVRNVEAQRAEAAVYAPPLPGIAPPTFTPPPVYGRAALSIMDLPMLRSTDRGEAPYAGVWSSPFAGVTVMDSATGDAFAFDTSLPVRATMGETVFDFYSGPTAYFDRVNTLRVKLYSGALASVSEDTVLSGGVNALAIENADGDWEVLQFATAELVDTGTYDLSVLLRGRLGTEHAMRSPVEAGARVVVLDAAVAQMDVSLAERGVSRSYKWGPSPLNSTDTAGQQSTFTARCVGLMPWSPVHVRGSRDGSGNLSITWIRRTRFGGVWTDGADVPLNEESERYEVDILDGDDVIRTIEATSPAVTYSATDQAADFGSAQSATSIKVYQLSVSVGRGRGASATL